MTRIIINIIGFYVGWFSCVLAAAHGVPLAGVVGVAIVFGVHLFLVHPAQRTQHVAAAAIVTAVGTIIDAIQLHLGVFLFKESRAVTPEFILWIGAFWLNFAITVPVCFRWLYNRLALASILGAISAPGAYVFGAYLGALDIPDPLWRSGAALAVEWAILMPFCAYVMRAVIKEPTP